jgi:hypothetical protein
MREAQILGSLESLTHHSENAVTEAAPDLCKDRRRSTRDLPTTSAYRCRPGQKNEDGRHVGLDFYDLLIEARYPPK